MQFRSPPPLPTIFLMDGHLAKTRGGKKGQIKLMIRFRFLFLATRVTTGRPISAFNLYFLETRFEIASGLPAIR